MERLLLATGQNIINQEVAKFEGYEVVDTVSLKADLEEACDYHSPDIVLISEGLTGSEMLIEILIRSKAKNPNIRFIYLAGEVELRNVERINRLATLVMSGIYDIHHEKKINVVLLRDMLKRPKSKDQVEYLLKYVKKEQQNTQVVEIEGIEEEKLDTQEQGYTNVIVISSIKPGTGKSFISTNVATAIAKYGKRKADGKPPRVALIEGDLQNLSVGTLLQIEDDNHNLKTVMSKLATVMTKGGEFLPTVNEEKLAEVDKYIKSCFKPYYNVKNLEALVGSQLTIEEVDDISPYFYLYLLDVVTKEYDVVIIDSNSSLGHVTTYPILKSANKAYYVLNLDFNNVRNNARYKTTLHNIGVSEKIHYILNEDIEPDAYKEEPLIYTAEHLNENGFKLEAKIPEIPKTIFLNRLYEGTPIVLDSTDYTLKARLELSKVADQIWPIENLESLDNSYEKMITKQKTVQKKGFFGR